MAENCPKDIAEAEAEADSIDVGDIYVGDVLIPGPNCLSVEAKVKMEIRRMMKKARLELNAEEYTMILTDKNGTKKCLKPEDTIDDNLEPLSEPVKVEFVKYGIQATGGN